MTLTVTHCAPCFQGEWVWVDPGIGVPIGARVKLTDTGHQLLVDDEGKEHKLSQKEEGSIRVMHPTSVEGVDDMIRLGDLNEAGLLRNLLVRHRQGIIYTYTGSVLVAVNPYQELPLYTADQVRLYHGRRLGELPPHVFAIADTCYFNMRRHNRDQCCIISGESGAGKTESTKLVLQFLAAVSGQHSWIEQQILEANPILEAFGNAKTIRNDNSSRFGKYVEIFFNKDGAIEGARMEQYLLEKSRVCHQAMEERNYHIFYCMLAGMTAEQKKTLCLGNAAEFSYLKRGDCIVCDGRDDAKDYTRIRTALKILAFTETHCWEILKLLAALLHLGNVSFEGGVLSGFFVCFLQVQPAALAVSLTYRSFMTNRERVSKPLNSEQAADSRDAFVKAIYGKLFIWIVGRINSAIHKTPTNGPKYVRNSIGLLDIFGFENFDSNSFEQLCINFANEQLQQFFVRHVFKLEQEEYTKEDIVWKNITFSDNTDTLDLLAVKPLNVLALIDEESHFPKGTDVTMLNKMNRAHAKCNKYIPSKNTHDMEFGIRHFAGVVHYDSNGFLEKNRDALNSGILKLIEASTNTLLQQLFEKERQVSTLSGQFRQSLDSLMNALSKCQPHFILCFKPNDDKKSMVFDRNLCIRQLRYSGMIDTIKIRKLGFPIRHTFKQFLQRYRVLLNTTVCDPKTVILIHCRSLGVHSIVLWRFAHINFFFIDLDHMYLLLLGSFLLLSVSFNQLQLGFERLQSTIRGRLARGRYLKELAAAVTMQSQVRGYLARKSYKSKREAVTVLQAHTRGMLARKTTNKMKTDVSAVFLSAQERMARERSAAELQQRLEDVLSQSQEAAAKPEPVSEQEMVETMFGFLPNTVAVGGREGPAPEGFEDLERTLTVPENEEFSFTKFSALHFQGSATYSHIKQRLRQPLLYHEDEGDALACLTVWWIILRFMGDIAEPKLINQEPSAPTPSQNNLGQRQNRRLSNLVGLDQVLYIRTQPQIQFNFALSVLVCPCRDEIYCQIIKQLVNNKNQNSSLRGWVLLSICLGIFPPTELLMQYLESFLGRGPSSYGPYCAERLRRIVANGERGEPPCWIELQAVKTKKTTQVSVALMDGLSVSLPVDSACTSAEVCQALAKKVNLKDIYGFSLYIGFCEKVWSLGSGGRHVMDAISQCEQEVRRKGEEEQHAPWRLYFRKELFTPWHDSSIDAVSTDLIYRQVIRGLKSGEYHSEKEDDFVQLAAMYYYVTFGSAISGENAKKVVEECITTELIETKSQGKLIQLVNAAHTQGPYINSRRSTDSVKGDVVDYARQKWPMYFSKFYEVTQMSGPPLPKSNFIVAINWNGISFQDEKEKKLIELSYPEVTGVNKSRYGQGPSVSLATLRGQFLLQSVDAGEMADLIQWYLEGLKERSVYAVALQDVNKQGRSMTMNHLITHLTDGEYSPARGWIKGTNERTGNTGAISTDTVLVLPTLEKPSDTTLVRSPDQKKTVTQNAHKREEAISPVSLKEFALEYFRQPGKEGGRGAQARGAGREKLWAASKEPIKQPLLKIFLLSLTFPSPILKYMGDYPIKQVRQPIELTDQIFGPATQHVPLQDEVYCQIMRQMTSNSSRYVVDYGWQLMWLCTGLFSPSQSLLRYTQRFLESRPREPLAADCLQRLQMLLRKLPPHQVEVDAIQQNSNQIFHKIHFPNDSTELFEVTSTTRIRDLVRNIAYKLILASADGYGLFMKTPNKVNFKSLSQLFGEKKKHFQATGHCFSGAPATMPYLVIFMRKLWFNVTPGRDLTADLTFHFPQELPKYLRGYHKCTKEEMISLAGLLFRVKVDTDKSQFVMIPRMLKELVPADEMKTMSPEDWKKHIISSYNKQAGITLDEAKVAFLKGICHWPTFGCAFFEVKQTSEPSYPSIVQIAISKQGVSFIDPKTKELLVMHLFNRITNWSSGSTYFHMTIGNLVKGNSFLCETSLGYKMDDLLSSYVNMYEMQRQSVRPRNNSMFPT
uniref:Myosin VIIBb n=1 Tax=Oncorhynchus tshawytscha TaxID=74940 RepID=A0A8C8MFQ5_ONCTS